MKMASNKNEEYDSDIFKRIVSHISKSDAVLKSQQKNEPDLTGDERSEIASKLLLKSPSQFLYRFGKYMQREHLQYFMQFLDDPEVMHYVGETQKLLNEHTSRIKVKNRRFSALQKLQDSGDYFSQVEMKRRKPLLYEQLIEKHMSEEERNEQSALEDKGYNSFAGFLLTQIDHYYDEKLLAMQKEVEEDSDESDSSVDDIEEVEDDEKELYKEEFRSSLYSHFLFGKDNFDYSTVDNCEDYDNLKFKEQDDEDRYFAEEEDTSGERSPPILEESVK